MSMEYAFLRALDTSRSTPLAPKVRKAIRHTHRAQPEATADTARISTGRVPRDAAYRWRRLGQRWATLRLGGCAWVGPIESLRTEWRELINEVRHCDSTEIGTLLESLADGLGLSRGCLDARSRDFLLRLAASRPEYEGGQTRLEGFRWFSPATLLVETMLDLSGAGPERYQSLRDSLADHNHATDLPGQASANAFRGFCRAWGSGLGTQ